MINIEHFWQRWDRNLLSKREIYFSVFNNTCIMNSVAIVDKKKNIKRKKMKWIKIKIGNF